MIKSGSKIQLLTKNKEETKFYALVAITSISSQTVLIRFCSKVTRDKEANKPHAYFEEEIIPMHQVVKMSERL